MNYLPKAIEIQLNIVNKKNCVDFVFKDKTSDEGTLLSITADTAKQKRIKMN